MWSKLKTIIILILIFLCCAFPASAKTTSSARAENVFFYAEDKEGNEVLLKLISIEELEKLSHGQNETDNYYYSSTDNYPAAQYCEARGITIPELLSYIASASSVTGAESLGFEGQDRLSFMATDSYGNYSRSWTAEQLFSEKRYYFEGLYNSTYGWKAGWETAGENNSKYGISLSEYNSKYRDTDSYYGDKLTVFNAGVEMPVLLAVQSVSGRTDSETLMSSSEPGLAAYIAANNGIVGGSMKNELTEDTALRLCIPMTEADLMSAHRTAHDNFKWIYRMRLQSESSKSIVSEGKVSSAAAVFTLEDNTLYIELSCATEGASIFYGFDGAPQNAYSGVISVDVSGRDLKADPLTIFMIAVKEGWSDSGIISEKYPAAGIQFKSLYTALLGESLCFEPADSVSEAAWNSWKEACIGISMKAPGAAGYTAMEASDFCFADRKLIIDGALISQTGSYSFAIYAKGYANKLLSVSVKRAAPDVTAETDCYFDNGITLHFSDDTYGKNLSVYVLDAEGNRSLISSGWLDRSKAGELTIKAEYFVSSSTAIKKAGSYILELSNSGCIPSVQQISVVLQNKNTTEDENTDSETGTGNAYNILLSLTETGKAGITVSWQDTETAEEMLQLTSAEEYSRSGFSNSIVIKAKKKNIALDDSCIMHYEATVSGLTAGVEYVYRVGHSGAWSELHSFTAKTAADTVTFAFLGDAQTTDNMEQDYAAWGMLLEAMRDTAPELSFALLGGDMVNSGVSQKQYDCMLSQAEKVFSDIPLMVTNGNHESNFLSGKPELMLDIFAMPENGPEGYTEEFYSFDVGNVHVLSLNSWVFSGEQKNVDFQAIEEWIKADLLSSEADWQVVFMHNPAYAVASDKVSVKIKENWSPIFEQYGVDIVFVGHQHVYARSYPLYEGVIDYDNGIPYVMGVSGSKFYSNSNETLSEKTVYNTSTYQLVNVSGSRMTVQTMDAEGNELDYFTVRQRKPGMVYFSDVRVDSRYYEAIQTVVKKGLFNGVGDGQFAPDESLTRAMLVTVLYRMAGMPKVNGDMPFSDVESGRWYSDAVIWAAESGLVFGDENGRFMPEKSVTREQLAQILYSFADGNKCNDVLSGFSDADQISSPALEAVNWAVEKGIINGVSDNLLEPQKTASRAQAAVMFQRLCEASE